MRVNRSKSDQIRPNFFSQSQQRIHPNKRLCRPAGTRLFLRGIPTVETVGYGLPSLTGLLRGSIQSEDQLFRIPTEFVLPLSLPKWVHFLPACSVLLSSHTLNRQLSTALRPATACH